MSPYLDLMIELNTIYSSSYNNDNSGISSGDRIGQDSYGSRNTDSTDFGRNTTSGLGNDFSSYDRDNTSSGLGRDNTSSSYDRDNTSSTLGRDNTSSSTYDRDTTSSGLGRDSSDTYGSNTTSQAGYGDSRTSYTDDPKSGTGYGASGLTQNERREDGHLDSSVEGNKTKPSMMDKIKGTVETVQGKVDNLLAFHFIDLKCCWIWFIDET